MTDMQELVVPKSMQITFAMEFFLDKTYPRTTKHRWCQYEMTKCKLLVLRHLVLNQSNLILSCKCDNRDFLAQFQKLPHSYLAQSRERLSAARNPHLQ